MHSFILSFFFFFQNFVPIKRALLHFVLAKQTGKNVIHSFPTYTSTIARLSLSVLLIACHVLEANWQNYQLHKKITDKSAAYLTPAVV